MGFIKAGSEGEGFGRREIDELFYNGISIIQLLVAPLRGQETWTHWLSHHKVKASFFDVAIV